MSELAATYQLYLAAFLFSAGVFIILTRHNLIFILMGVELMLNAGNLILAFFAQFDANHQGEMMVLFSIVITVCEATIALAILLNIYKQKRVSDIDQLEEVGND